MTENTDDNTFWITRREQYECLMSSRRMDIIDLLANTGPRSIREIASLIGVKPSSLYHHIDLLLQVDLIELAGTRVVNRRQEKLYQAPGRTLRYGMTFDDPGAFALYSRIGDAQARQSARDLRRGMETDAVVAEGPTKNTWVFRVVGAPDDRTMTKINHHLQEIAKLFWSSASRENPLVVMSAIMAPVARPEESASKPDKANQKS